MTTLLLILLSFGAGENALACADFNGDSHPDLLVADERDAKLHLWTGDGTGKLAHTSTQTVAANPTDLALADINADGHLDVVIAHHELDQLTLLTGDGKGGLKEHARIGAEVKPHPHVVRIADINRDKLPDLLIDDREAGGVMALLGAPGGTFDATPVSIDLGGDPYLGFAVGDVNSDGLLDIAAPVTGGVTVAIQKTHNSFELARPGVHKDAFATELVDIDGDGHLDLVTARQSRPSVQLYRGNAEGTFRQVAITTGLTDGAKKIAVGDLDGNGLPESVIINWSGGVEIVSRDASFDTAQFDTIPHPWGIAVCDLNGDGADDVVLTDGESSQAEVFLTPYNLTDP